MKLAHFRLIAARIFLFGCLCVVVAQLASPLLGYQSSLGAQSSKPKPALQSKSQKLTNPLNDLLDEAQRDIDNKNFEAAIVPLQKAGERQDRVESIFGVMTSNLATPEYQKLDREWSPKLSAASDEIILNPKLFQRIKAIYEARDTAGLDAKQKRLVTRQYESFARRGANLNPEQKQQLSAYNQQLAASFSDAALISPRP